MLFAIFYAIVTDDDGIFVDGPFYAGLTSERERAEALVKDIANDKRLPGTVIPKIWPCHNLGQEVAAMATRQINRLATEMYDTAETQARSRKH